MKNKKLLALLLAGVTTFACASCGNTDKPGNPSGGGLKNTVVLYKDGMSYTESEKTAENEVYALSYEIMGGSDVMPVGGFYAPYASGGSIEGNPSPDFLTDYYYKVLSEAGINMFAYSVDRHSYGSANENVNKALDLCEKYNIGYFVDSFWVMNQLGSHTDDYPLDKMTLGTAQGKKILENIVDELSKNGTRKSFLGLHSYDEPFTAQLDNIGVLSDAFYSASNTKGLDMYLNARGYWAGEDNFWGYSSPIEFGEYLDEIFKVVKPKMLSATQYPYISAQTSEAVLTSLMYNVLAQYRSYSKKYGVPFRRMLQAGGQWNDELQWIESKDPYPSEGELLYDVNMALCYGAKAIQYFPLIQPFHFSYEKGGTYDFTNRNGLIGADGNLTRWYYYAKRANTQVQAVDEYLMHSSSEKILVHGDKAIEAIITAGKPTDDIVAAGDYRQLKSVSGDDAIVGCFNYKGKTALYVVNYSRTAKANVNLSFDKNNYRYTVIQRGETADVVGGQIPLTLDAGEGALIVLA